MRLKRAEYWALVVLIVACTGCSRFRVESAFDPAASFKNLHTYAWKPDARPWAGDPRVREGLVDRTMHSAVDGELGGKGFTQAAPDAADFLVAYDAGVDFKSSTVALTRWTTAADGAWAPRQYAHSSDYEQGMVVLLMFDRASGKLTWRGVATGIFDPTATSATREQRLRDVVHKLLKGFPPH